MSKAHSLIQEAMTALSELDPRSISRQDIQHTLGQVSGLATNAAMIALEAGRTPFEALNALEEARCIISGLSMNSNADISELQQVNPELACRYEGLRTRLSEVSSTMKTRGNYRDARIQQAEILRDISKTEAEIRTQRGWESFQLPMTEENIQSLASEGPIIVVNAAMLRCDAIVVTEKEIKTIPLPGMKYKDLERNISLFNRLGNETRRNATPRIQRSSPSGALDGLLWLWKVAVQPILSNIELTSSKRVWWITTGLAGRAPFHAAGDHSPGSQSNTHSQVISSYISSFKALRFARERLAVLPKINMLLVTMASNPGPHHDLNTSHEEKVTKEVFGDSMEHLAHPDPKLVLKKLADYSVVHFACHGFSIAYDPSKSGLLLLARNGDEAILSISDLEGVKLRSGAIAYLSACSTAEQADGKLADEAIHLANSFQALGFQHVIGTMWGADDIAAGAIAKAFYARLFSSEDSMDGRVISSAKVANALHEAVGDYMRSIRPGEVVKWAPFIHVGA